MEMRSCHTVYIYLDVAEWSAISAVVCQRCMFETNRQNIVSSYLIPLRLITPRPISPNERSHGWKDIRFLCLMMF